MSFRASQFIIVTLTSPVPTSIFPNVFSFGWRRVERARGRFIRFQTGLIPLGLKHRQKLRKRLAYNLRKCFSQGHATPRLRDVEVDR